MAYVRPIEGSCKGNSAISDSYRPPLRVPQNVAYNAQIRVNWSPVDARSIAEGGIHQLYDRHVPNPTQPNWHAINNINNAPMIGPMDSYPNRRGNRSTSG